MYELLYFIDWCIEVVRASLSSQGLLFTIRRRFEQDRLI